MKAGYVKRILISVDQLGNAIAGGNPDCTISGRIGYFQYNAKKPYIWYWHLLAFVVDSTFYPWDGHGHCKQTYHKEKDEQFLNPNSVFLYFILSLITLVSCAIMAPAFWIIWIIKCIFIHIRSSKKTRK